MSPDGVGLAAIRGRKPRVWGMLLNEECAWRQSITQRWHLIVVHRLFAGVLLTMHGTGRMCLLADDAVIIAIESKAVAGLCCSGQWSGSRGRAVGAVVMPAGWPQLARLPPWR